MTDRLISCDDHMDLSQLPADLWTTRLPASLLATSHAQNDAVMFELTFRDERHLPFEGAGAVSRWRIELPRHQRLRSRHGQRRGPDPPIYGP